MTACPILFSNNCGMAENNSALIKYILFVSLQF